MGTHSQLSKFNMFHPQILVLLTDPTSQLQETYISCQIDKKNPSVGIVRANTTKRIVQQAPNQIPPKYKSTKDKQHNLIKAYHTKFQDRRQINELCTPASDSSKEFNNFITEFENIMLEDSDDSSA